MVLVGNMKDVPEVSWCAVSDTCTAHQAGGKKIVELARLPSEGGVSSCRAWGGKGQVRLVKIGI